MVSGTLICVLPDHISFMMNVLFIILQAILDLNNFCVYMLVIDYANTKKINLLFQFD